MTDRTYRVAIRLFAAVFRLLGLRITVRGADHLPASGPAVLASNHTGFLDFTFVGYAARERGRLVRFMSKVSVFDSRVTGPLMRAMRHIPVDRWTGAGAYRQARRALEAGEVVGVFPEATISRSFLVKRLKPGAAGLAISRSVPLIPVAVWGSHRIATVDGRRSLRRGKALTILLGEPLHPADGETIADLTERLHLAMTALVDEAIDTFPDAPRDDADRWWLPHDRGGTAPQIGRASCRERV